jgi:hypothetical protein
MLISKSLKLSKPEIIEIQLKPVFVPVGICLSWSASRCHYCLPLGLSGFLGLGCSVLRFKLALRKPLYLVLAQKRYFAFPLINSLPIYPQSLRKTWGAAKMLYYVFVVHPHA